MPDRTKLGSGSLSISRISVTQAIATIRVLVAIASYGTGNDPYLRRLLAEYRSMPFRVDVVVLSNIRKQVPPDVEIAVGQPTKDPNSLPFLHRGIFAKRLNDYDVFIYSEDDTLITARNIEAFLEASEVLPESEIPGFIRFELDQSGKAVYPEVHGHAHWDSTSVRSRGQSTFAYFTNEHAACYLLTRRQLERAINSSGFLVAPHQKKYDLVCSAGTDPYTQCGFQKMICISRLDDFAVHHLSNKYVGKLGIERAELCRQIEALLRTRRNGVPKTPLFETRTKLRNGRYSKAYYEAVRPEVISAVPSRARSVLSIGCGWGATEKCLVDKGLRVVAMPLDSVIAGAAEAKGVEIVDGDFFSARKKLDRERFDCILLLDILHLVPNPVDILSLFGELLSPGGVAIMLAPNLRRISIIWRRVISDPRFKDLGIWPKSYENVGMHFTSRRTIRNWVRSAGMKLLSISSILPPSSLVAGQLALGLVDPYLASEFLVVAEKAGEAAGNSSSAK
jgi:2-polyprenyl-3-methyl-5-hydroxy-6-metoxy-1,4-benzoquinol methylase